MNATRQRSTLYVRILDAVRELAMLRRHVDATPDDPEVRELAERLGELQAKASRLLRHVEPPMNEH